MHGNCRRCGKEISTDSVYCEYCGIVVSDEKDTEPTEEKKSKNSLGFLTWWIVNDEKIKYQANNYYKLKLGSYRTISALCLVFAAALTSLFVLFGSLPTSTYVDAALFLFLAIFVYLGHRWALVTTMILWTFEKGYAAYEAMIDTKSSQVVMQIFWWAFFMNYFYKAFKVEQLRKRMFAEITSNTAKT